MKKMENEKLGKRVLVDLNLIMNLFQVVLAYYKVQNDWKKGLTEDIAGNKSLTYLIHHLIKSSQMYLVEKLFCQRALFDMKLT